MRVAVVVVVVVRVAVVVRVMVVVQSKTWCNATAAQE